jgi:hypothetical protein
MLVRAADVAAELDAWFGADGSPGYGRVWVQDDTCESELTRVKGEIAILGGRGLTDEEEDAERVRLRAQRDRLTIAAELAPPAHWELRPTGRSNGQVWASMGVSARREWLMARFVATVHKTGPRSVAIHYVGVDGGGPVYVSDDQGGVLAEE